MEPLGVPAAGGTDRVSTSPDASLGLLQTSGSELHR